MTRENTAKVIKTVDADVLAMVEVEGRWALKQFDSERLNRKYDCEILFDGNDLRGIDVGLYSKLPIGGIWTHIYDRADDDKTIFSRDCLEVEVKLPNSESLWVLVNHFKSKGGGGKQETSDAKRKSQADRVAEILSSGYDLEKDLVAVAGDLNDTPDSETLKALLSTNHLYDVLEAEFPDPSDRWTYHYKKNEQIDYLLVSKPLRDALVGAGLERRGMPNLDKHSGGTLTQWDTVTGWKTAASDHAAVWADFDI